MKKTILFGLIIIAAWGVYQLQSSTPKEQVRQTIEKVLDESEVDKRLSPVQAAMRTKSLLPYLDQKIRVEYQVKDQKRSIEGQKSVRSKLTIGLNHLQNFEFELLQNSVKIHGHKAIVKAKIRGRGEIINYMQRFSEIHRFHLELTKKADDWKISLVRHIPYEDGR